MIDFIGLELIEFHDVPIKRINIINSSSPTLEILIMLWNEDINDYIYKKLIFGKLNLINPKTISFKENVDLEIFSFDYHLESILFYGKMVCLTSFGKPSFDIEFTCQTVELIDVKTEQNTNQLKP